jgi:hypothetical protein
LTAPGDCINCSAYRRKEVLKVFFDYGEKCMSRSLQDSVPQLVDTKEAAKILGRSAATLKRWRQEAKGPDFVMIERRVSYDLKVLLDYIQRNTRVSSVRAA